MSVARWINSSAGVLCLVCELQAQTPDILSENTGRLNVQMTLDRSTYFPGEAAVVTITVTNPTSGPLQVLAPFTNNTGCLVTYNQPAGGPPSPYGADTVCDGLPIAAHETVIAAGAQVQIQLNGCCEMFDFGGSGVDIPEAPGTYSINYFYAGSGSAPFSVVVPHLDAAGVVQMSDLSYTDPTTGETVDQPSYMHLFALRSGNQSYICVTVSPVANDLPTSPDVNGNYTSGEPQYKRIATSQNPVVAISGTTDGAGNLAIQWQDSTGAMFTGNFTAQYELVTDAEPDASGWVIRVNEIYYAPGTVANLIAVPNPGYSFVNWTGAPVANPGAATTSITMSNGFSLTANFAANGQTSPTNISTQMPFTTSPPSFNSAAQQYLESVTFTNTSGQYIGGPVSIVLTNLSPGFTLLNATGAYNGSPYIQVQNYGLLSPGQSYTTLLEFSVGPTALIRFTPVFYSGL